MHNMLTLRKISNIVGKFGVAVVDRNGLWMPGMCTQVETTGCIIFYKKEICTGNMKTEVEGRSCGQSADKLHMHIIPS